MGLSIHYQGKIKDYAIINEMMEELADICKTMNWRFQLFEPKNPYQKLSKEKFPKYTALDVKGIAFTPENCETVSLTFLPSDELVCPAKLVFYDHLTNDLMIEIISVKTQYAGPELHIALLKLLQYISKKYFASFILDDEGEYWGKWDEKHFYKKFARYDFLVNSVTKAVEGLDIKPGDTPDTILAKIESILQRKMDSGEFDSKE